MVLCLIVRSDHAKNITLSAFAVQKLLAVQIQKIPSILSNKKTYATPSQT